MALATEKVRVSIQKGKNKYTVQPYKKRSLEIIDGKKKVEVEIDYFFVEPRKNKNNEVVGTFCDFVVKKEKDVKKINKYLELETDSAAFSRFMWTF